MKEKLVLPADYRGDLWLYNKNRFLDRTYQSFLHCHDEIELNMVTSGRGVYILNSRKVEMLPNTILWLFPDQEHLLLEKTADFEMWILVMRPNFLQEICTDSYSRVLLECDPAGNFCRSLPSSQFLKLCGLCRETLSVKDTLSLFNISLGFILLSAWAAYQTAYSIGPEKRIHPAIEQTAKLIMDGEGRDDLQVLARRVGLSPTSLSRLFKKQMGVSITTFRNRCHVEQFIHLYGDGQSRTMLDAALDAGFGSYAQFFRVFKEIMGGSPSEYRRSL